MGCQAGVEAAKLTTVMNDIKAKTPEPYETIKLGIDVSTTWYSVGRQLDGGRHSRTTSGTWLVVIGRQSTARMIWSGARQS
ncbi:MAG: lipid-binding SYLF domain-containing protein [Verrucomicrobiales bacterium]|jgi:lipid-binding SYLF domain-containing protein